MNRKLMIIKIYKRINIDIDNGLPKNKRLNPESKVPRVRNMTSAASQFLLCNRSTFSLRHGMFTNMTRESLLTDARLMMDMMLSTGSL